jgi:sugar-specific transcriptional regulator TrmB
MLSQTEMLPFLNPALDELGLTEYEKKLYLLSMTLGPVPVSTFAEHLGISRPNVYKVIIGLEEHGLAQFSDRTARTKKFVVESPHILIKRLKEKRELLEKINNGVFSVLPDLVAMYQQGDRATSLKVFDTEKSWVDAFFQVLDETKDDYLFFGNIEKFLAFAPSVQQRWVEERVKRNVHGKLLTLPSEIAKEKSSRDKEELRETRFLSSMKSFEASFLIFGKTMILWQPKAPLAILVDDEYLVQMFHSVFDCLWEQSPAQNLAIA